MPLQEAEPCAKRPKMECWINNAPDLRYVYLTFVVIAVQDFPFQLSPTSFGPNSLSYLYFHLFSSKMERPLQRIFCFLPFLHCASVCKAFQRATQKLIQEYREDISRGKASHGPIYCMNDADAELFPRLFIYSEKLQLPPLFVDDDLPGCQCTNGTCRDNASCACSAMTKTGSIHTRTTMTRSFPILRPV